MANKLTSLGLVLVSSLLLAGCTKQAATTTQTPAQTMSEAAEFAKAIESGSPTLCTLTKGTDSIEYLIKGKLFKMTSHLTPPTEDNSTPSTPQTAYTLTDGLFFYSWSDQSDQGIKTKVTSPEEVQEATTESQPSSTETPQLSSETDYDAFKNQGYTINCVAASAQDSDFLPPENIKFIDPSELMMQLPTTGNAGSIDIEKLQQMAPVTEP